MDWNSAAGWRTPSRDGGGAHRAVTAGNLNFQKSPENVLSPVDVEPGDEPYVELERARA